MTDVGVSSLHFVVTDDDTAIALGSGDVPVLATPRLLAWLEAGTVAAVTPRLAAGETSVGTRVEVEHVLASPVGASVVVHASVGHTDGRLVRLEVAAEHTVGGGDPVVVARGRVTRVVVDRERFLDRVPGLG
jgi:predicted thioesterase